MKKYIIGLLALLVCGAAWAAQNTDITPRQVRDPKQLEVWLDANAADAQSRLASVEAGGVGATITSATLVSNANLKVYGKTLEIVSGGEITVPAASIGATALSGNIAIARISEALKAPGAIGGTTPAAATVSGLTVGKAGVASGVVTLTGTTSGTATLTVADDGSTITANKPILSAVNGTLGATAPATASVTDLTASGTTTLALALGGPLKATNGVVSAGAIDLSGAEVTGTLPLGKLPNGAGVATLLANGLGASVAYPKTSDGTLELLAAKGAGTNRACIVVVTCTETFATGDGGTKPTFLIGETTDTDLFFAAAAIADLTAGDTITSAAINTAERAVLVTATQAVGEGVGAITVTILALPTE
jgi:hypothetical protein